MTHHVPYAVSRRPWLAALWFGLLAGFPTLEVSAAAPAPVAPITSAGTRFTDNGNGTVTDSFTGLIWLKDANCITARSWDMAIVASHALKSPNANCSLNDGSTGGWRLPNRHELQSLIDYTMREPSLPAPHPFVNVQTEEGLPSAYWTSTTHANPAFAASLAWMVMFFDGEMRPWEKNQSLHVWPVRGGE